MHDTNVCGFDNDMATTTICKHSEVLVSSTCPAFYVDFFPDFSNENVDNSVPAWRNGFKGDEAYWVQTIMCLLNTCLFTRTGWLRLWGEAHSYTLVCYALNWSAWNFGKWPKARLLSYLEGLLLLLLPSPLFLIVGETSRRLFTALHGTIKTYLVTGEQVEFSVSKLADHCWALLGSNDTPSIGPVLKLSDVLSTAFMKEKQNALATLSNEPKYICTEASPGCTLQWRAENQEGLGLKLHLLRVNDFCAPHLPLLIKTLHISAYWKREQTIWRLVISYGSH